MTYKTFVETEMKEVRKVLIAITDIKIDALKEQMSEELSKKDCDLHGLYKNVEALEHFTSVKEQLNDIFDRFLMRDLNEWNQYRDIKSLEEFKIEMCKDAELLKKDETLVCKPFFDHYF